MWRMEPGLGRDVRHTPGAASVGLMLRILSEIPWRRPHPRTRGVFATGRRHSGATLKHGHSRDRTGGPLPRLLSSPHHRPSSPRQDRGEVSEGHLDQPGHRRAQALERTPRANAHRRHLPQRPHQLFRPPDFWEDAVLLLELAGTSPLPALIQPSNRALLGTRRAPAPTSARRCAS